MKVSSILDPTAQGNYKVKVSNAQKNEVDLPIAQKNNDMGRAIIRFDLNNPPIDEG